MISGCADHVLCLTEAHSNGAATEQSRDCVVQLQTGLVGKAVSVHLEHNNVSSEIKNNSLMPR